MNQTSKLKSGNFKDEEEKEKHMVSLKVDRSLAKMRKVPGNSDNFIATGTDLDIGVEKKCKIYFSRCTAMFCFDNFSWHIQRNGFFYFTFS